MSCRRGAKRSGPNIEPPFGGYPRYPRDSPHVLHANCPLSPYHPPIFVANHSQTTRSCEQRPQYLVVILPAWHNRCPAGLLVRSNSEQVFATGSTNNAGPPKICAL